MKKLLNTMPSTKPDQLYRSQPSQSSFLPAKSSSYQKGIQNLLTSLKSIYRWRYYLYQRDMEDIFKSNEHLFNDLLSITTFQDLWRTFVLPHQQYLRQQQQINLLLRILIELNKRKQKEGDLGNIKAFEQHRTTIEWLIPQIVAIQSDLRLKIEEKVLQACEAQKKKREIQFNRYEVKMKKQFETMESIRKQNLNQRIYRERQLKQYEIKNKIEDNMHKIRASSQLRNAKETSLLRKLAPYRWDKKKVYEDETYKNQLEQTLHHDEVRRLRVIQNMKRVEKEKLNKAHDTLVSTQEMYAQTLRDKMTIQLQNQRSQFKNFEDKTMKNLKHSVDMTNKLRISSLRKSLEAYNQHQDTLKIKEIMNDHHLKVQFNNNIEDASRSQGQAHLLQSKYCTIQIERQGAKIEKAYDKHQRRLQKRLKNMMGDDGNITVSGNYQRRKSLVDLYDKSLNLVQ